MTVAANIRGSSAIGGLSFQESRTRTGDGQIVHNISIAAADAASLTTRTDNTDGVITADESDHRVSTGDRVDLYWTTADVNYQRRGVTVGTVSAELIPISGGDGDNLPIQDSDIVICVVDEIDLSVDGDNIVAVLTSLAKLGQIVFLDIDVSDVEITTWFLGEGVTKTWDNEDGDTNPFVGVTLSRVYISHSDTAAAATAQLGILYDNVAG